MDSLELPIDLIWEGKIEPLSPNQLALVNSEDIMIFENDLSTEFILNHSDIIFDGKKSPEEILFELQQDIIEDEDDDESTQWLDEPITLPILAAYSYQPHQRQPLKIEQTAQLLREFDSVLDAVELTHLTPPQTPPQSPQIENLNDLKLDQFIFSTTPQSQQQVILNSNFFNFDQNESVQSPACSQDIAHEMEVVDELVRSYEKNLPHWTSDDDNSSQSSSPNSSPRSSSDDSFDNASQSFSNDDEWSPTPIQSTSSVKRRVRSSEDKKSRKKEQNKNAATRYRQKKKAESEVVQGEERELQDKNDQLHVKCADIQREIKYLKSLMRDLYQAKGLL